MSMGNLLLWRSKKKRESPQFLYGGHGACYCVRGCLHWVQQRQWWCLSPSADGASWRKGVNEERTVRPQRGCCTRKLFTILFCTSSSAEVKRRLRKTASWTRKGGHEKKKGDSGSFVIWVIESVTYLRQDKNAVMQVWLSANSSSQTYLHIMRTTL